MWGFWAGIQCPVRNKTEEGGLGIWSRRRAAEEEDCATGSWEALLGGCKRTAALATAEPLPRTELPGNI